jgi:hypothetical protein
MTTNFVSPLSFVAVFGYGIRDPVSGMGKNQDPGSGINIPDPLAKTPSQPSPSPFLDPRKSEGGYTVLVGFGRACAPMRCAHPSFWALCHTQQGAARPPAHRSFAAPPKTPK